jgi:prepilin peptidase CpaA
MLISYASGWFGGGDVKLIIAISPFVAHGGEIVFLQIVGCAGLILAFIFSLRRPIGNKTGHIELPFGVAISAGFLFSVLLH